jgi:hypothetical protein
MGQKSKRKGKVGEREAAAEISRLFGVSARRGVQYQGGPASPDIVTDLAGIHFEVKRAETLRIYDAVAQATSDAAGGIEGDKVPVVLHRQNGRDWLAIVPLDSLPQLAFNLCQRNDHKEPNGSTSDVRAVPQ